MNIKKILIIVFLIFLVPINIYASNDNTYEKYLALGDSIAAGYGLKNIEEGYAYIIKNELKIKDENFNNLAIGGTTAQKFNELIRTDEYKSAIEKADLITVSIGANELLKTVRQNFCDISGITIEQTRDLELFNKLITERVSGNGINGLKELYSLITNLYERLNSDEVNTELIQKIEQYKTEWKQGIDYIKEINPKATIVVTEFYNPYYNLDMLYNWGEYADKYIREFNKYQYEISNNEEKYKIARIYEEFNVDNPRITNVSLNRSAFSIDPHPNIEGHKVIAKKVLDTLEIKKEKVLNNHESKVDEDFVIIFPIVITIVIFVFIIIIVKRRKTLNNI